MVTSTSTLAGQPGPTSSLSLFAIPVAPLFLRKAAEVAVDAFPNAHRHIIHQIHIYNHSLD